MPLTDSFWKDVSALCELRGGAKKNASVETFVSNLRTRISTAVNSHDVTIAACKSRIIEQQLEELDGFDLDAHARAANKEKLLVLQLAFREASQQGESFLNSIDRAFRRFLAPASSLSSSSLSQCISREIFRLTQTCLPSLSRRVEFDNLISSNQVVIVRGQTGSGKSTQLPQYVAELALLSGSACRKVVCTQPRKIAATSLATRVALEFAAGIEKFAAIGFDVGYRVGGKNMAGTRTKIEYVTEDAFLNTLLSGSVDFRDIFCIVVDEAHERNISTDVLLGLLRSKVREHPHLKVVITSATLDPAVFSRYFNNCPTLEIPGRTFPVDIIYSPPASDKVSYFNAVVEKAVEIHRREPIESGDILCFLTGQDEVEKAKVVLGEILSRSSKATLILTAYGRQSAEDQAQLFARTPAMTRKIIIATDVAETSVTIDGVRFVVDSGVTKDIAFDPVRNTTTLLVKTISQSSAIQRKGRAGRTSSGVCYRLYSQQAYDQMPVGVVPELLRVPLTLTVVNLLALDIDATVFDWLNPPEPTAISHAIEDLLYFGAISRRAPPIPPGKPAFALTALGKFVCDTQLHPGWAKMVFVGCEKGMGEAAVTLAAIATVSDSFFWRVTASSDADKRASADASKQSFASPWGDLVMMFNIYSQYSDMIRNKKLPTYIPAAPSNLTQSILADGDDRRREEDADNDDVGSVARTEVSVIDTGVSAAGGSDNASLAGSRVGDLSDFDDDEDESFSKDEGGVDAKEVAEEEQRRAASDAFIRANKTTIGAWLRNNFISKKALDLVDTSIRSLLKMTQKYSSLWQTHRQDEKPAPINVAFLLFNGMFLNYAVRVSAQHYRVVGTGMSTILHPSSVLHLLPDLPAAVCFQSILQTKFVMLVNPMPVQPGWLQQVSADFFARSQRDLDIVSFSTTAVSFAVMRAFVGKMGERQRDFEQLHDCSIKVDAGKRTVTAWMGKDRLAAVQAAVEERFKEAKAMISGEVEEVSLNGNTRAIIGAGGRIVTLLFGAEYCAVTFRAIPTRESLPQLKSYLDDHFAPVLSFTPLEEDRSNDAGRFSAHVFFSDPSKARTAVAKIHNQHVNGMLISAIPAGGVQTPAVFHDVEAQLRLSYSIGISQGEASLIFVDVPSANKAIDALIAAHPRARVTAMGRRDAVVAHDDGEEWHAERKRGERKLVPFVEQNRFVPLAADQRSSSYFILVSVQRLRPDETELDLRKLLVRAGVDPLPAILVKRIPSFAENKHLTAEFVASVQNILPLAKELHPVLTGFKDDKRLLGGFVATYPTAADTQSAFDSIAGNPLNQTLDLDGRRVQMEVHFSGTFSLAEDLHRARQIPIEAVLASAVSRGVSVRIKSHQPGRIGGKHGMVFYGLRSESLPALRVVQRLLEDTLVFTLYLHPFRAALFSFYGRQVIKATSFAPAYLSLDNKCRLIRIYGDTADREAAKLLLDHIIVTKLQGNIFDVPFTVSRRGETICHTKADEFRAIPGLLDLRVQHLCCWASGTQEALATLEKKLKGLEKKRTGATSGECFACFCDFDDPFSLALCGHTGCRGCLEMMIGTNSMEAPHIPIVCRHTDGCDCPLTLSDLRSLAGDDFWQKVVASALQDFLDRNREAMVVCPKPGCGQVARAVAPPAKDSPDERRRGGHVFDCESCVASYCLTCSEERGKATLSHPGEICKETCIDSQALVQKHRRNIVESFNMKCPSCLKVFFDFTGCCALRCGCGCNFCGICLIDTKGDAHPHVRTCPKNPNRNEYFLSEAQLAVVKADRNKNLYLTYLQSIPDATLRHSVAAACSKDLADLGIRL